MHAISNVSLKELLVHRTNTGLDCWDISEKLKRVKNPIRLVYGKHDLMVRAYAGEQIKRLVKGKCTISIVDGTHTLPTLYPERVLSQIAY